MDSDLFMIVFTVIGSTTILTYASYRLDIEFKKVRMLQKEIAERENAMKQAYARLGTILDQQRYMIKTLNRIECGMFYTRSINKAKEEGNDAEGGNE